MTCSQTETEGWEGKYWDLQKEDSVYTHLGGGKKNNYFPDDPSPQALHPWDGQLIELQMVNDGRRTKPERWQKQ